MTDHLAAFFADEFPGEVRTEYRQLRARCIAPDEALEQLLYDKREAMIILAHERMLFWIALAATQARAGELNPLVRERAKAALDDDMWLPLWADSVHDEAPKKLQLKAARAALDGPASERIDERAVHKLIPPTAESLADFDKESVQFAAYYTARGIDIVKDDPSRVVACLHRELEELGPRYQATAKEDRDQITGRTSLVWVRQVLRLGGWKLSKVVDEDGNNFPAVVTADDAAWVPIFFAALDYVQQPDERLNILAPLFEEIRANRIPRSMKPGGLTSLIKYSWRMEDPTWPGQREQLLTGQVGVDSVDRAMADLFSALSEAGEGENGAELDAGPVCEVGAVEEEATERRPPDAQTVAGRALALRALLSYTLTDVPRDVLAVLSAGWSKDERKKLDAEMMKRSRDFVAGLQDHGVWDHMDASERATIETPLTELEARQLIVHSWRAEALSCLLWALRRLDGLPPYDEQVDGMRLLQRERFGDGPRDFLEAARLREADQIEHARTLAEMWNWRARTRQLHEEDAPFPEMPALGAFSWNDIARISAERAHEQGMLDRVIDGDFPARGRAYRDVSVEEWQMLQSIAQERHFALNWLCGYAPNNEWLKTPTGT